MQYIFTLVFLTATFSFALAVTKSVSTLKFARNTDLDDVTCSADYSLFSEDVETKFNCAFLCEKHNTCYTIFYTENTRRCFGCNTVYTSSQAVELPPADGNIHYQLYPSCEDGWTGFMRSCYKLSSHDWFPIGAAECESEGGHAVYIETSVENEFLKEYVKADTSTWAWYIGITDCPEQGVWRYYGSEELVNFTDFKELNAVDSCSCALFFDAYDYRWARFECEHPGYGFPTICEVTVS